LKHITLEDIQQAEVSERVREDLERVWQERQDRIQQQARSKDKTKEKGREL
jgi:hypothetical protein